MARKKSLLQTKQMASSQREAPERRALAPINGGVDAASNLPEPEQRQTRARHAPALLEVPAVSQSPKFE